MRRANSEQRAGAMPALDLVEEATQLLRRAPIRVLVWYVLGSVPFVIGLLYFWADMSRSAFAASHCAAAALGLALLYAWMKTLQAMFARELRAWLAGESVPQWSARRLARLAATQTMIHCAAPWMVLLASVILFPYGWVCAFYHNASVMDDDAGGVRAVARPAAAQARLWPQQNHALLSVLYFFGLIVWLNVAVLLALLPHLLKMLLGVETVYTLSGPYLVGNTTFLAITCGLTYLALNPLVKAAYVLRCFYGESRATGADLRLELRMAARVGAMALWMIAGFGGPSSCEAADPRTRGARPSTPTAERVNAEELDRAANDVLQRREYSWRAPRPKAPEKTGWLDKLLNEIREWVNSWRREMDAVLRKFFRWLRDLFGNDRPRDVSLGSRDGWMTATQALMFVLLATVVCVIVLFAWRVWQRHRRAPPPQQAKPVASTPDLEDENVMADELPVDGWLAQARELMAQGNFRLALRALYLASLAQLARQELLVLAKFKSNREYARELQRRAHAHPAVFTAFTENLSVFEAAWYGVHEVTAEAVQQFETSLRIFGGSDILVATGLSDEALAKADRGRNAAPTSQTPDESHP